MAAKRNASSSADLPGIPPDVRVITWPNGLTLIVREDHSAPVVSAQAWSKAGSIDEGRWLGAGLSHVLEHMLFKGTSTRGAGRIDQEVQEAGGYMNAYTSFDRTVYWINVPNTGARVALDILGDIMQHATLPADELGKEMDVIRREMDMNHDDPSQRSARRLFETAYTRSPYRFPVIGYPDIFNQVTRDDLLAYYREKYAPNNIFLVVVGDIHASEVEEQVRASFASAKAQPIPASVLPIEPRQTAAREIVEEAPIEMGHFHFSWHIPELRHPDVPLLDVLATLLGSGRSSRLFQRVREKQGLVNYADAWTYSPGSPGLFGMSALVEPEKFDAARAAMLSEVERMRAGRIALPELRKAVKQFTAAMLATRKTMQGQAQDLGGNFMAAGDLNFSARYLEAVKRATPAELQRVARTYLTVENRTLYALLPAGRAPRPVASVAAPADHPVASFVLPNGLRVLVKQDHRLPFVELRAVFRGGVLHETPATNGLTLLTAKTLLKGTRTRTAEEIATEIESVGGSIESYGGNNSLGVNVEIMHTELAIGLDLLADVILHPSFPREAVEREREVQLASIRAQKDELLASAIRLMRRGLFGESGYGLYLNGTEQSVSQFGQSDVRRMHGRLLRPDQCVLAVFGHIHPAVVRAAVKRQFASWRAEGEPLANMRAAIPARETARLMETRDKKQAVLVMGFPGSTLFDADRYALELLHEACSDLGSRLFLRIREKLGLAYYVGAQHMPGLTPGYFGFYAGTEPSKAEQVEQELLAETELLRREGLSPEELKRAQAKVIGQRKIARQDLGHVAMTSALDELYGLGYAYSDAEDARYEAVTVEETRMVARKYLDPQKAVVALIRP